MHTAANLDDRSYLTVLFMKAIYESKFSKISLGKLRGLYSRKNKKSPF
jgi:hypothetical protein